MVMEYDITGKVIVIKIGGSTLGEGDSTIPDVIELWKQGARPVVVHGGGKVISEWVAKQGIQPVFVRGLRRTDRATLDVAVAVLAGLVNSELVAEFTASGANAIGISGVSDSVCAACSELGNSGDADSVCAACSELYRHLRSFRRATAGRGNGSRPRLRRDAHR